MRIEAMKRAAASALALLAMACGGGGLSDPTPLTGLLRVESFEVAILESFPPQAIAQVVGSVPDVCTSVDGISVRRAGRVIEVTITTRRPDGFCILLLPPPATISVHLGHFPEPGEYIVRVNGVERRFKI